MILFTAGILILIFGFILLGFKSSDMGNKWRLNPKQLISFVGVILIVLSCFTKVNTGHTGIVTTFGKVESYTYEAGIHFNAPWREIIQMDNRNQKKSEELDCFSSDIQEVTIKYTINYQIDKLNAQTIYKTIGTNYYDIAVLPLIQQAVKEVTAQYTAENLVSAREEISQKIEATLMESLSEYNVQLVGTAVENIDFTDAFTTAVEEKQVAQQNKLKAEADAQAKVIAAQATADANALQESSITDKILLQQFIAKWDGKYPTVMSGDSSSMLFDISSILNQE